MLKLHAIKHLVHCLSYTEGSGHEGCYQKSMKWCWVGGVPFWDEPIFSFTNMLPLDVSGRKESFTIYQVGP